MIIRSGSAVWEGNLKSGRGNIRLESGLLEGPYSFASRFESGKGTNPEELIGAAHAGCFSMALSHRLSEQGYMPKRIGTTAKVHLNHEEKGFRITAIELITEADVGGIDRQEFLKHVEYAKKNCPVSKALTGTEIRVSANLTSSLAK